MAAHSLLKHLFTLLYVLLAVGFFEPVAYLCLCLLRFYEAEPVAARGGLRRRYYFHDVVVFELVFKLDHGAVDFGVLRMVAHVCMNSIGKVDGRRACRKINYFTLRSEDEHEVREEVLAYVFDEFARSVGQVFVFKRFAQPRDLAVKIVLCCSSFLVHPVCRNAVFCGAMHLLRPYLHFERHSIITEERRMQGSVLICFRHGDIVLEAARHGRPNRVYDAERCIAVVYGMDYNAYCDKVVYLVNGDVLLHDLFVYAVEVLWTAADLSLNANRR